MAKYKPGDKFIIEIESVLNHVEELPEKSIYKIKGFDSLVMTDYGLDHLKEMNGIIGDEADDKIGLQIGDPVEIEGELYYYNGHYDYVYSEVGYNYCFVRNKNNINTDEERAELYKPNYDITIDSRDLDGKSFGYVGLYTLK